MLNSHPYLVTVLTSVFSQRIAYATTFFQSTQGTCSRSGLEKDNKMDCISVRNITTRPTQLELCYTRLAHQ